MPSLVRSVTVLRGAVLFTVAALSLAACRKKPAPAPAPTPQPTFNEDSARRAQAYADSVRRAQERQRFVEDSVRRANAAAAEARAGALRARQAPVDVDYDNHSTPRRFDVAIQFTGELTDEQVTRLEKVAAACPLRRSPDLVDPRGVARSRGENHRHFFARVTIFVSGHPISSKW